MSTTLTIRDIARMAGVSTTAVSFVLNNKPGVSDSTRKKVQDIIERTGFTPNVHTRRLNLGKSFTIHVVLWTYQDSLYDQFAQETFQGIFNASKALGYSIVFTFAHKEMGCAEILDSVHRKECDGVILYQVSDPAFISMLQQEQIPFICVDAHVDKDGGLPLVEVDYYDAAYKATTHLCENGHKRIGYIGQKFALELYMSTFSGYADALKAKGLMCDPAWMVQVPFDEEKAEAIIGKLLDNEPLPTAFLCAGDAFAVTAMRAIKARGLRIPEDISLIGLDDLLLSRYVDPPLSSIGFDKIKLGQVAMETLYAIIRGEEYENVNLLPTRLVSRSSVRNINE